MYFKKNVGVVTGIFWRMKYHVPDTGGTLLRYLSCHFFLLTVFKKNLISSSIFSLTVFLGPPILNNLLILQINHFAITSLAFSIYEFTMFHFSFYYTPFHRPCSSGNPYLSFSLGSLMS